MLFGLFGGNKDVEILRGEVKDSFNHVKKDFNKVGEWIKHLDVKTASHETDLSEIKTQLDSIQKDIMELKDFVSFFGPQLNSTLSKHHPQAVVKQTIPFAIQTVSQTGVQTGVLDSLTVMERAIVWALLNAEMHLSYEDLAALLGKDKSTIRGQINAIKQKNEGLIMETVEFNGKKRLHIPEEIRQNIIKSVKVKVKEQKKAKK